jgi:hypothetical protein
LPLARVHIRLPALSILNYFYFQLQLLIAVKDFLNKILVIPGERISHPIFGPFILSWIAFNWEALAYFIFHDQNMKDKIDYLSQRYNNEYYLLVFPIISTLIYKVVLPYVSTVITYLLRKSTEFNSNEKKLHLKNLNDQEEEEIRRIVQLEDLKIQLKEQVNNKGEIEGLLKQLEDRDALIERERDRSKTQSEEHKRNLEFMEKTYVAENENVKSTLNLLQIEKSALTNSLKELQKEALYLRLDLIKKEEKRKKALTVEEVRNHLNSQKNNTPKYDIPDEG